MTRPESPCSCLMALSMDIYWNGRRGTSSSGAWSVGETWWCRTRLVAGICSTKSEQSDIGVGEYQVLGDRLGKNVGSGRLGAIHWRAGAQT